jgi:hypothetical protein
LRDGLVCASIALSRFSICHSLSLSLFLRLLPLLFLDSSPLSLSIYIYIGQSMFPRSWCPGRALPTPLPSAYPDLGREYPDQGRPSQSGMAVQRHTFDRLNMGKTHIQHPYQINGSDDHSANRGRTSSVVTPKLASMRVVETPHIEYPEQSPVLRLEAQLLTRLAVATSHPDHPLASLRL